MVAAAAVDADLIAEDTRRAVTAFRAQPGSRQQLQTQRVS